MQKDNKQRITLLTRKEKSAAVDAGWLDTQIPTEILIKRLKAEGGVKFDIDAVMSMIQSRAAYVRADGRAPPLEPREIIQQSTDAVAIIEELLDRLECIHPNLEAESDVILHKDGGKYLSDLRDSLKPQLQELAETLELAGHAMAQMPSRTGPKPTQWTRARDDIAAALRVHSSPPMPAKNSIPLSVVLLEMCGLPNPRS